MKFNWLYCRPNRWFVWQALISRSNSPFALPLDRLHHASVTEHELGPVIQAVSKSWNVPFWQPSPRAIFIVVRHHHLPSLDSSSSSFFSPLSCSFSWVELSWWVEAGLFSFSAMEREHSVAIIVSTGVVPNRLNWSGIWLSDYIGGPAENYEEDSAQSTTKCTAKTRGKAYYGYLIRNDKPTYLEQHITIFTAGTPPWSSCSSYTVSATSLPDLYNSYIQPLKIYRIHPKTPAGSPHDPNRASFGVASPPFSPVHGSQFIPTFRPHQAAYFLHAWS